jgi:hypothetical protein
MWKNRVRRTASNSSATKEEKKVLGILAPGAEYMSKIGRGKEKNAKAVAGSQLPVARKTWDRAGLY